MHLIGFSSLIQKEKANENNEVPPSNQQSYAADEDSATSGPCTPDSLKEKGNLSVRDERYSEAVLHYSFAIKMNPTDPILYSNRSYAFLKLQQLYYANEDAEKAIHLKPDWAKVCV